MLFAFSTYTYIQEDKLTTEVAIRGNQLSQIKANFDVQLAFFENQKQTTKVKGFF